MFKESMECTDIGEATGVCRLGCEAGLGNGIDDANGSNEGVVKFCRIGMFVIVFTETGLDKGGDVGDGTRTFLIFVPTFVKISDTGGNTGSDVASAHGTEIEDTGERLMGIWFDGVSEGCRVVSLDGSLDIIFEGVSDKATEGLLDAAKDG